MDRRRFLQMVGLGGAAFALDPELLLWTPGKKTIFIPPAESIPVILNTTLAQSASKLIDNLFKISPMFTVEMRYGINGRRIMEAGLRIEQRISYPVQ